MDTVIVLLIVIAALFLFDCGVIIYLAHTMKDMKDDNKREKESE